MKFSRFLGLATMGLSLGFFSACTSESDSAPGITTFEATFAEATDTWTKGLEIEFYGTVTDDNKVATLKLDVLDSTGATVLKTLKTVAVSGTSVKFGVKEATTMQITNDGSLPYTGKFVVRLTATDDAGATSTKTLTFVKIEGTAAVATLTSTTVELGSNDNATLGSSLDADAFSVYKISQITTAALQGDVDVYYAYSATGKVDRFYTPAQAKLSEFDGIKSWTVSDAVKLYDLGTKTETEFTALNTQAAIDALFTGKTEAVSVDATADKLVGIVTSKGAKRIIRVNSITTGSTGSVTVKGYK